MNIDSEAFAIGYKEGFNQEFKVNVDLVISSLLKSSNDELEKAILIWYARGYYDGLNDSYK